MSQGWNCHKWRRDTTWWDDLVADPEAIAEHPGVFSWLEAVAPDPYEHDYVLYTDGSGCDYGWGGYAAVWERIDLVQELRAPVSTGLRVAGTYGSTVQRCELNAFLDGVHGILTEHTQMLRDQAVASNDQETLFRMGSSGVLNELTGPERLTILWYTDRSNLAKSLLFGPDGEVLNSRQKDRDLWLRWSLMARHVCITPMCRERNVVSGQAMCDRLAGITRGLLKGASDQLASATTDLYSTDQWKSKKSQTAKF